MNWCAGAEQRKAEAALNTQWRETRAKIEARDEAFATDQPRGHGRPGHFESLLEAQRA